MRKLFIAFLLIASLLQAKSSCRWTAPYFREYTNKYLGILFDYRLFMAQAYIESKCRINAISNDGVGSQGIGQITWRWWKHYLKPRGIPNLNTIDRQVKAQVLIMRKLILESYEKTSCTALWIPFQAYNGGWLVAKEIKRAKSCSWSKARLYCRRRIVYFLNGLSRSACDINYNYSKEIYNVATRYYKYIDNGDFWE